MIRNLKAGTFKKTAIGAGVCGALLLAGASLLVWTYRHGNDPESAEGGTAPHAATDGDGEARPG